MDMSWNVYEHRNTNKTNKKDMQVNLVRIYSHYAAEMLIEELMEKQKQRHKKPLYSYYIKYECDPYLCDDCGF